jgi:hypothetical protein
MRCLGITSNLCNVKPGGSFDNHQSLNGSYIIALLVFVACHVHTGMFIFISDIMLHLLLS